MTKTKEKKKLWTEYELIMEFEERLCGSFPQNPDLVEKMLRTRNKKTDEETLNELIEESLQTIGDEEEAEFTVGFQRVEEDRPNAGRFFLRGGTVKAHLKDCANQVKDFAGIKAFKAKLANKVYVSEYRLFPMKENSNGDPPEYYATPDGQYDQPVHAMTQRGPINALKSIQYLQRPVLRCTLKVLTGDKEVTQEAIETVLEYGAIHGYGGERSLGEGRYQWLLTPKK